MATADHPPRKRTPWIWISAVLAIVAAGLLIWALTIQSDLDSTQEELASTQQ
jgi:type VI protein secretion system component VasF